MMQSKPIRKCGQHLEPVTRICLDELCSCPGVLCERCMNHHKHISTCKIDHEAEPLSFFNINTGKPKDLEYFTTTLQSLCKIWENGNEIIQQQLLKLESTFLMQLNLVCRTFALDSAEQLVQSLKYKDEGDESNTKINIQLIRSLHKNKQNIQNIDEIKLNTNRIYKNVADSLKKTYQEMNKSFQKLNQILTTANIFNFTKTPQIMPPNPKKKKSEDWKEKATLPAALEQKFTIDPIIQKQQVAYTAADTFVLQNNNLADFQKEDAVSKKMVKIVSVSNPQIVVEAFLNHAYSLEYLIIESSNLATEENLKVIMMCTQQLKVLVLNCNNEVWKCTPSLIHYDSMGNQSSLERLEYYFDFRRDLEILEVNRFFMKKKVNQRLERSLIKDETHVKLKNRWSMDRRAPSTRDTFEMTKRLNLKNIWLPHLMRSQYQFGIENYDLGRIEEITLGHYCQEHSSIPFSLEQKLKSIQHLKSFTLIKTSHFILNLSNCLKRMSKLEVLVLEEIKYQGDEKHCQTFFSNIPKFCPNLTKLSITHLQNFNIDFIAQLPLLQTLILTKSSKLTFEVSCSLALTHLNLFQADWNYLKLLKSVKPFVQFLNLGYSNSSFKELHEIMQNYSSISSLCLDKVNLPTSFIEFIDQNRPTLQNLSIAGCQTQTNVKLADKLKKCENLRLVDINKCDIEAHIIKNYPPQLKYIVISSRNIIEQTLVLEMFTKDITIIESP